MFIEDECYLEEGLGRMINLPMVVQEACLGTLNIGSVEAGLPDPDDVDFLQQVATQIGFAIAQVNAYEEINRLKEQLARENVYLAEELKATQDFGIVVGRSQAFEQVLASRQAAPTSATVMVTGDTGTGKEVLARAIHERSLRRDRAFVRLNCAALPSGLIESELFGHERALLRALNINVSAALNSLMGARCFWTRSGKCRSTRRPNSYACPHQRVQSGRYVDVQRP